MGVTNSMRIIHFFNQIFIFLIMSTLVNFAVICQSHASGDIELNWQENGYTGFVSNQSSKVIQTTSTKFPKVIQPKEIKSFPAIILKDCLYCTQNVYYESSQDIGCVFQFIFLSRNNPPRAYLRNYPLDNKTKCKVMVANSQLTLIVE